MRKEDYTDYLVNFMGASERTAQIVRLVIELFTVLALLGIVWFLMNMSQNSQYCQLIYQNQVNSTWGLMRPII